jgi:hypothetical protein
MNTKMLDMFIDYQVKQMGVDSAMHQHCDQIVTTVESTLTYAVNMSGKSEVLGVSSLVVNENPNITAAALVTMVAYIRAQLYLKGIHSITLQISTAPEPSWRWKAGVFPFGDKA